MIGELYDRYEQKMLKRLQTVNFIKKHYKKVLFPLIAVSIVTVVFLLFVGTFTEELSIADTAYGKSPATSVSAFLSDVGFEYLDSDGVTWLSGIPKDVGEYQVRAVSTNGFGVQRYGAALNFKITPANLTLDFSTDSCVYGDELKTAQESLKALGIAEGDKVDNPEFSIEKIGTDKVKVNIVSFRIVNKNGEDVTDNYKCVFSDAEWALKKRDITFLSADATFIYDGTAKQCSEIKPSAGTICAGETYAISNKASLINAGTVQGTFEAKIVDANGKDVTSFYNISYSFGTLTVSPRKVTVQTESASKIYDGTPLTAKAYNLIDGSLLATDRLNVDYPNAQTDVGTSENGANVTVSGSEGRDVSQNYVITVNKGELKVEPRSIKVRSGSASKQCDGTPLTCKEITVIEGELASGQTLKGNFTCKDAILVGKYENTVVCSVFDAKGKDVSKNYTIQYEYGVLEITPIVLTFKTDSASKVYDDTPLTAKGCTLISGRVLPGHKLVTAVGSGSITDVGTSANPAHAVITDSSGKDITKDYYSIETVEGTLKITPRNIRITSYGAQKEYDGTPLTNNRYSWQGNATEGTVEGHHPRLTFTGSQTEIGSSPNTFTARIIKSATQKDVTANYNIIPKCEDLVVIPRAELSGSEGDGYDIGGPMDDSDKKEVVATFRIYSLKQETKLYLRNKSYGDYNFSGWDPAQIYEAPEGNSTNPLSFAGTGASNGYSSFNITLMDGAPMLVPYYINASNWEKANLVGSDISVNRQKEYEAYVDPTEITGKPGYIKNNTKAKQAEQEYRKFVHDNYLSIPESTKQAMLKIAEENGIKANSPTLIADIQKYISHAAVYKLDIEPFPAGVDKAVHFLTVTKEGYCQHFASAATLMYRAFGIPARYTVGYAVSAYPGNQLTKVTGEEAHAWTEVYIDELGWIYVEVTASVIGNGGGADGEGSEAGDGGMCDGNCGGTDCGGGHSLTADGKIIATLSTFSAEKQYDGFPFELDESSSSGCWLSGGSLLDGHRLEYEFSSELKYFSYIGERTAMLDSFAVYDRNGNDVTDMYYFSKSYGLLTITKREITIVSASASKVYDGTKLVAPTYWVASGALVDNDRLEITFNTSQTEVGTSPNIFSYSIIDRFGRSSDYPYNVTVVYGNLVVTKE